MKPAIAAVARRPGAGGAGRLRRRGRGGGWRPRAGGVRAGVVVATRHPRGRRLAARCAGAGRLVAGRSRAGRVAGCLAVGRAARQRQPGCGDRAERRVRRVPARAVADLAAVARAGTRRRRLARAFAVAGRSRDRDLARPRRRRADRGGADGPAVAGVAATARTEYALACRRRIGRAVAAGALAVAADCGAVAAAIRRRAAGRRRLRRRTGRARHDRRSRSRVVCRGGQRSHRPGAGAARCRRRCARIAPGAQPRPAHAADAGRGVARPAPAARLDRPRRRPQCRACRHGAAAGRDPRQLARSTRSGDDPARQRRRPARRPMPTATRRCTMPRAVPIQASPRCCAMPPPNSMRATTTA